MAKKERYNPFEHIMGVHEAAILWGLNHGHIKNLCNEGKLDCIKIGKTWIISKDNCDPTQRLKIFDYSYRKKE